MSIRKVSLLGSISIFLTSLALAGSIPNWSAPATWSPPKASHGLTTLGDISNPLPFIGVTPCRQYDSRSVASLSDNANLAVTLTGAPCGLPATAQAVSVNITVFDITGAGGNGVFRVGTATDPTTAWLNYPPTETQRGNAGTVPVNGSGQIVVKVNQGGGSVDFTVDVNGYYGSTPGTSSDYFKVSNSGPYAIYGQTGSSATDAAGVYGLASSSTGASLKGVWGDSSGTSGAIGVFGRATSTTGYNFGVWGSTYSTTAGTVGVVGEALATTSGVFYGVEGYTPSSGFGAAGVFGIAGANAGPVNGFVAAGVRGASVDGIGVIGISEFLGVSGEFVDSAGNQVTAGVLGFSSTDGVHAVGNVSATGAKPFVEPHPTDATKEIAYVALEGPEAGTYFRGRSTIHGGTGTIEVPESFRLVSDEAGLTVQITPIGQISNVAVLSADLNSIIVQSSAQELEFYYLVNGVRKSFKDWKVITENRHYVPQGPDARMPGALAPEQRRALIASGIYNPDGTVNMETAERLGWAKIWSEREEKAKAAAASNAAKHAAMEGERK